VAEVFDVDGERVEGGGAERRQQRRLREVARRAQAAS
jgi:hypothetical protein